MCETKNKDYLYVQYLNWKANLNALNDIVLKSSDSSIIGLKRILNGNKKFIIFYFESGMCLMCIQNELENLEELSSIVSDNNILLIAKDYSERFIFNSELFKNWQGQLYITNDEIFDTGYYKFQTPAIFIVDSDLNIKTAYHALKHTDLYFDNFKKSISN